MNNYLWSLIQSLDENEKEGLEAFLANTYFNGGFNHEKIRQLYALLRQEEEMPLKEILYEQVFEESSQVKGKLEKLMSELSGLLRKFLLINKYLEEENAFQQSLDWVVVLRNRGIMNRYAQHLARAEKILSDRQLQSVEYYYQQFQLVYEKHELESQQNRGRGDLLIPDAIARLDLYYGAHRLELLNMLELQQKLTPLEVPDWLIAHRYKPSPLPLFLSEDALVMKVSLLINDQLNTSTPSAGSFREILELLQTKGHLIDGPTLQNLYTHLRNLCILLSNQGQQTFLGILHDIHRDNLERGYLFYRGKLPPSTYLSVALTAIKVGQIDWALTFVEAYRNTLLSSEDHQNYYLFNKAQCLFHLGQFAQAIETLPAGFSDMVYLVNSKRLEIKLYYELSSDLLNYKLDAYKMYLSRSSKKLLSQHVKSAEASFVNLLFQVMNCRRGDLVKAKKIADRIKEKELLSDRDWLLDKVSALM